MVLADYALTTTTTTGDKMFFSALTLLVGLEGPPACKSIVNIHQCCFDFLIGRQGGHLACKTVLVKNPLIRVKIKWNWLKVKAVYC